MCSACFASEQSRVNISRGCLEHQNCLLSPLPIKTKMERFYYSCVLLPFHLAEHYWMLSLCQSHSILSLRLQPFRSGIGFLTTPSRNCEMRAFLRAVCSGGGGCTLHAAAECLYSPLEGKGSRRHSVIVADARGFAYSNPFLASVLHESLWINPCKCGRLVCICMYKCTCFLTGKFCLINKFVSRPWEKSIKSSR